MTRIRNFKTYLFDVFACLKHRLSALLSSPWHVFHLGVSFVFLAGVGFDFCGVNFNTQNLSRFE